MKWFSNLFGGTQAVDHIFDKDDGLLVKAGGFVNGLHYSDQERADDNKRLVKFGLDRLKALEPFKVTQRILAIATMLIWVILALNLIVAVWLQAAGVLDAVTAFMALISEPFIYYPIGSVITLYTGGGVIESFKRSKSEEK